MPAPSPMYGVSADGIALTAATVKTAVEIRTASSAGIVPVMWWVEFDGVSASALPVRVEVGIFSASTGATTTTATPFNVNGGERGVASPVTALTNCNAEAGTPTYVEVHRVSPTSGILVQEPLGNELVVGASSFWRIRLLAAANVNATVGVRWY